jgi:serine/threonine-protein kinase
MPKVCPVCGNTYSDSNAFCPTDGTTLRAADSDGDLIGTVVADRYLVTDVLGEGGMGKVFLARHVRLPQHAAIKVLRPELTKDPAAVARFNREAANACRIEHERVARVFDFGETPDGLVYLAMEYVAGRTLKDILVAEGPLSLARTATIVQQVADGLDAAHRIGIVHRDLKPDNILVTKDESDGSDRCKVVDFGIAKAMGSNTEREAGLTRTGFIVGTPEFMSPEQLMGGELDQRSDVYALALVAYQCLTKDLPFDSNTPDRGMAARLVSAPRPLRVVRTDATWTAALQQVFDQALERDTTKRTATAGAFAKAFETAVRAPVAPASKATPAVGTPAAAPRVDTPGAAKVMPSVPKNELPPARRLEPTPARNSRETVAPKRPSREAPVVAAPSRSFRLPRIPLPSLGLVLLVGAGWWWYTKQRAPRPADLDRLVNSAVRTADKLATSAQDVASSVQQQVATPSTPASGGTGAGTAPTTGAPPAPAAGGAVTKPAGTAPAGGGAARATLDSLTKALDPSNADEADARAAVPVLRALLPRLVNATDSTWAFIRMAEAHLLLEEVKPACTALRSARASANSMNQADVINRYAGQLRCGQ